MCIHVDRQRRARGRQPPSFGHNSCGVGGADGGSVAVVVGAIVESTPEPTADRTAVLFGRRERPSTSPGQEWFADLDGGEVTVDVTAGTRRPAPPPQPPPPPQSYAASGCCCFSSFSCG